MNNSDDLIRDINSLLSQLQQKDEEIQKLREERDEARRKAEEAWAEIDDAEQRIELMMKTCPSCKQNSYSSYDQGEWTCPTCQEDLTEVESRVAE